MDRNTPEYNERMEANAKRLNAMSREQATQFRVDIQELVDEISHMALFTSDDQSILLDLQLVPRLLRFQYQLKVIVALRVVQRKLRADHLSVLAQIIEARNFATKFSFEGYDLNQSITMLGKSINRHLHNAELAMEGSEKMSILAEAVAAASRARMELEQVSNAVNDIHHPKQADARDWLKGTPYNSPASLQSKINVNHQNLADQTKRSLKKMTEVSGISFDVDLEDLGLNFKWYVLGNNLPRGADFVKSFNEQDLVGKRIRPYTALMAQAQWSVDTLAAEVEKARPVQLTMQADLGRLSELFFDVEKLIIEGTRWNGILETSISWEHRVNQLSDEGRRNMRVRADDNMVQLFLLRSKIYRDLKRYRQTNNKILLPKRLENSIASKPKRHEISTKRLLTLEKALSGIENRLERAEIMEIEALKQLCIIRKDTLTTLGYLVDVNFLNDLYNPKDPASFEKSCNTCYKLARNFQEFLGWAERLIVKVYREGHFGIEDAEGNQATSSGSLGFLSREIFDLVFSVYMDHIYWRLRQLDYEVIGIPHFRQLFENAKAFPTEVAMPCMERLFLELHSLPSEDVLIMEMKTLSNLGPTAEALEQHVISNNGQMQALVNEIQNYLRGFLTKSDGHSRRLRFEVFSLADCYSSNLKQLIADVMLLRDTMGSVEEGDRIIEFLEDIEKKTIEAQQQTHQSSNSYGQLEDMAGKGLSNKLADQLRKDLEHNYKDLTQLMATLNDSYRTIRLKQAEFGRKSNVDHLGQVVNYDDLHALTSVYSFVPTVHHDDIKRFAKAHSDRDKVITDLLSNAASRRNSKVPIAIASRVTPDVFHSYEKNKTIDLGIKTLIYARLPHCLKAESHFLALALNYITHEEIHQRVVYKGLLDLISQVKDANMEEKRGIRAIWIDMKTCLEEYEPEREVDNYERNFKSLQNDVSEVAGAHFTF